MTPNLNTITRKLASNGARFVALSEELLHDEIARLLYYYPEQEVEDEKSFHEINEVEIDGEKFAFYPENVLHTEVHFSGRVPVYASENPTFGLNEVTIEEGRKNVRECLSGDCYVETAPSEEAEADSLLRELVDAGATAIGVEKELFRPSESDILPLVVYMPPATGVEVVEGYETARFDGSTYDLDCTFTVDGPEFGHKVPLYADDTIGGLSPVSVEEGLTNLRSHIE